MGTKEIDCSNTNEIVCPYCGYEYEDSWEFSDDGTTKCYECNKEFNYNKEFSVSYSTSKIECKGEHSFEFEKELMSTTEYTRQEDGNYKDVVLPNSEWKFTEIFSCSQCDKKDYRKISQEDYIKKYYKDYERWKEYHFKHFVEKL